MHDYEGEVMPMEFELNESQLRAVSHEDGPMLVLAGPGSGKSLVIVERVMRMIKEGVESRRILVVTFTRKAAQELKCRILKALGPHVAEEITCGTFHSICYRILKAFAPHKIKGVVDDEKAAHIISRLATPLSINIPSRDFLLDISYLKSWMISPEVALQRAETPLERRLSGLYQDYQMFLDKESLIDYDDMIQGAVDLFDWDDSKHELAKVFDYVLVDEYQDINRLQQVFLDRLCEEKGNLFVVGDDAQSIYAFRGADISSFIDFSKKHRKSGVVALDTNYRSTQNIIDASSRIVKANRENIPKRLKSSKSVKGLPIFLHSAPSPEAEAFWLANKASTLPGTSAILVRVSRQMNVIFEALNNENVPYVAIHDSSRDIGFPSTGATRVDKGLHILTIHASKGLEFDNVFIPGLEEGILPHYLAKSPRDVAEERRLLYVAATRAKRTVLLSFCLTRRGRSIRHSRFLSEIPKNLIEVV
jgi:DNA helicase-2/ATP-dependent DNA helicase PcrA